MQAGGQGGCSGAWAVFLSQGRTRLTAGALEPEQELWARPLLHGHREAAGAGATVCSRGPSEPGCWEAEEPSPRECPGSPRWLARSESSCRRGIRVTSASDASDGPHGGVRGEVLQGCAVGAQSGGCAAVRTVRGGFQEYCPPREVVSSGPSAAARAGGGAGGRSRGSRAIVGAPSRGLCGLAPWRWAGSGQALGRLWGGHLASAFTLATGPPFPARVASRAQLRQGECHRRRGSCRGHPRSPP